MKHIEELNTVIRMGNSSDFHTALRQTLRIFENIVSCFQVFKM